MNQKILDKAYDYGQASFKKATIEAQQELEKEYPEIEFNNSYEASRKGINLHIHACELGFKIHGGMLKMDKALSILKKQNPGFSESTYEKALSEAFVETR